MSAKDAQVGGAHYKHFKIQPYEFFQANGLRFCEANAIKYICRHRDKGGKIDLEKAIHTLELLIEMEYPSESVASGKTEPCGPADGITDGLRPARMGGVFEERGKAEESPPRWGTQGEHCYRHRDWDGEVYPEHYREGS